MTYEIRQIDICKHLIPVGDLIRRSHQTVAEQFDITPQICPHHPAFCDDAFTLDKLSKPGTICFGAYVGGELLGFVALVTGLDGNLAECVRLAVAPEARCFGLGRSLMDECVRVACELGATVMAIEVIDWNEPLKQWYLDYGFVEICKQDWGGAPFLVCYMELKL